MRTAPALIYAGLGAVLASLPLVGVLHVESSAVVAGAAFFVAGLAALGAFARGAALRPALRRHLVLLAVPWAFLTATLLWRPNCAYAAGFGFYVLFAVPSVVLGVALAYALTGLRRPRLLFVLLGFAAAVLPVAYDLGLHPQLYTYNHVFGGVLGPIYDEELAVRPGLFAFRAMTLLWAAGLVLLGRWRRAPGAREVRRLKRAGLAVAATLGLGYALAVPLGINTSYARLDAALGARAEAGPFVVHYDSTALAPGALAWRLDAMRFRYDRLRARLGVAPDAPVHVYLYPDPDTRGALIGSRRTSVTPVWLAVPQLHMLQDAFTPDALGHELVHVFSREFGLPVLRASPAVGLVEGLAVALEPPDGLPSPAQQVAATLRVRSDALGALEAGPAEAVAGAMSPLGFWTGRGAVSYVTTGAFTAWLLDRYGADALRRVYASADFEGVYGRPVRALAEDWADDLATLPRSPEAEAVAAWRFAQPSLFERRCPHHVPPAVRWTRAAREAEENGDAAPALDAYRRALAADSAFLPALVGWAARMSVEEENPAAAVRRLRTFVRPDSISEPAHLVALGDAFALLGESTEADAAYRAAADAFPPWADAGRALVLLRAALAPADLRVLLAAGDAAERAALLERGAGERPVAALFAAWLWREAGEPERAFSALSDGYAPADLGLAEEDAALVQREAAAWRADFALCARAYAEALEAATAARALMQAADEGGSARRLTDVIAQARWHLART